MATNNSKFDKWCLVINEPKEKATTDQDNDFFMSAASTLQNYNRFKFFASIIHDKDILENGEPKTKHMHIVYTTPLKNTILGELKEISSILNIDKRLLSLEGSNNEFLMVQYLTHKNQPNKTQYDYSEIITNNSEELEQKYNFDYKDPEAELLATLQECETITDFAIKLGPTKARQFLGLFKDMQNERKEKTKDKLLAYEYVKTKYDALLVLFESFLDTCRNGLKESEKRLINLKDFEDRFNRDF